MAWTDENRKWMQRAIALAREGDDAPGKNPIGCVIVRGGTVIGEGCNEVDLRHDTTAHAEIVSMRRAGKTLQSDELRDAALYTTLQPRGICTMASIWAKIGRIVYGAGREDVHKMYFEDRHLDTSSSRFGMTRLDRLGREMVMVLAASVWRKLWLRGVPATRRTRDRR